MPTTSTLTRKSSELAHIVVTLPAYADRLAASPATSWLTADYITSHTAPAQAFFDNENTLEAEVSQLGATLATARAALTTLASATRFYLKGVSLLADDATLADSGSNSPVDVLTRAELQRQHLVRYLTLAASGSHYVNATQLLADLVSHITAYTTSKNAFESEKNTLTLAKREYVTYEDAIDDLWHTVTSTLSGLFHEEREILYAFLPSWRKSGVSVTAAAEAATQPTA